MKFLKASFSRHLSLGVFGLVSAATALTGCGGPTDLLEEGDLVASARSQIGVVDGHPHLVAILAVENRGTNTVSLTWNGCGGAALRVYADEGHSELVFDDQALRSAQGGICTTPLFGIEIPPREKREVETSAWPIANILENRDAGTYYVVAVPLAGPFYQQEVDAGAVALSP